MRELLYEAARALPHLRLFRRNILKLRVIDARTQLERMVIAGIPGQCDLYGIQYGGRCMEVELKSENGRLTPDQRTWRDWCLAGQVPWMCLWPWPGESKEETVQRWVAVIIMMAGPANGTLIPPIVAQEQTAQTSGPAIRQRRGPIRSTQPSPPSAAPSTGRTRGRASRRSPAPLG